MAERAKPTDEEAAEWRDALMSLLAADGPERARELINEAMKD